MFNNTRKYQHWAGFRYQPEFSWVPVTTLMGSPKFRLFLFYRLFWDTTKIEQVKYSKTDQVRIESLYGMNGFFRLFAGVVDCSASSEITFPNMCNDLFMLTPSYNNQKPYKALPGWIELKYNVAKCLSVWVIVYKLT